MHSAEERSRIAHRHIEIKRNPCVSLAAGPDIVVADYRSAKQRSHKCTLRDHAMA